MCTFLLFSAIAWFINAFLLGISYSAIQKSYGIKIPFLVSIIILTILFAVLQNMLYPAVSAMQLSITVGNIELASFLGMSDKIKGSALFSIDYIDIIIWFYGALLALFIGNKIIFKKKIFSRNIPVSEN